ncbi:MAG: hypothetical protein C0498_05360 [Anaerolinea sp.]|nr:hypothetical protein [Anaerolinea sp.]
MDRRSRSALIVSLVLGSLAGCTSAGTAGPSAEPSAPASGAVTVTTPSPASSAAPSTVPTLADSAAPSAAPITQPAAAKPYDCTKLITDAEMRQATGLSTATFFNQVLWTDRPGLLEGQTYCQFFAGQGATSIALSVLTGPSLADFDQLWAAGSAADSVPGIGDAARVNAASGAGGARVGGLGITVFLGATGDNGLVGVDVKDAITRILAIVATRV